MPEKNFYLDKTNKKIAGVCAGLSEYFNIDVTLVRAAFVVAFIFASFGFWAYIVIWAIAPAR